MPDQIQFEGEGREYGQGRFARRISIMSRWIITAGLAKDDAGAQKAFVVILIITVIATAAVWIL